MIAGLEPIASGDIRIGDRIVNSLPPKDRDIAMVFQTYALYPHKTVAQNMGFALMMRKTPRAEIDTRVRRAAEILDLVPYLERYPRQLSGGQRQRVAMGRAIVRDPKVFLGPWRNKDISFFFLSQLILPPVVLAMPFLVLYKELALLDNIIGLILVYTLLVLPIVIWIMRDQFDTIPIELEQAALVDGCTVWSAFFRIVLPIALPSMVAAFILSIVLCWNEYFFAALLTSTSAKTLPVMVASQTGSQGISWWSMAALSTAAVAPLIFIGILLERFIVKGLTAGAVK